jgi:hypothetical protein
LRDKGKKMGGKDQVVDPRKSGGGKVPEGGREGGKS